MKHLPDLHKQAMHMKNFRRLKHDGGRAWIKDSQLFDARSAGNPDLVVSTPNSSERSPKQLTGHAGE